MARYIIKIHDEKFNKDYYLEWSTVTDAPASFGYSSEEFRKYYKEKYGPEAVLLLDERLKRVEKRGVSARAPLDDLEEFLENNRAGENGQQISQEEILEDYCRTHKG